MLPTRSPQIETQAFVYFNADEPMEIEPVIITGDEADLRQAIKCLADAGLLSPGDIKKYGDYIDPPMQKSFKQRLKAWRERNGPR